MHRWGHFRFCFIFIVLFAGSLVRVYECECASIRVCTFVCGYFLHCFDRCRSQEQVNDRIATMEQNPTVILRQ